MRRTRSRRVGAAALVAWLAAVAVTGLIASRAVAVLDTATARTGVISQAEVDRALAAARAAASPTASPPAAAVTATATAPPPTSPASPTSPAASHRPTSGPTAAATPHQPPTIARTWPVTGGTVAASCAGSAISLLYATPADGWTVEVGATGPQHIEVELKQPGSETTVVAVCIGGVPQPTLGHDAPESSGDGSSDG